MMHFFRWLTVCLVILMCGCTHHSSREVRIDLHLDDTAGSIAATIDGAEVLTVQHGEKYAIPHIWPLRSPSGKLLTAQHPDPYPHHRSVWIADKVQLGEGPVVDFYHCWKNLRDKDRPNEGYLHFIHHRDFTASETRGKRAVITAGLEWVIQGQGPVLDEMRTMRIAALGNGEYLLDLSWKLTATYGDVTFASDWVHYAWPYLRMHPGFSGEQGGRITDDKGRHGQEQTNGQYARWIDYSNTIDGVTEGLAVFIYPDGDDHKWLTREYGTFGPRRADRFSGTGFTLRRGESLHGRVGILVHRGDVEEGRVAERYRQYVEYK